MPSAFATRFLQLEHLLVQTRQYWQLIAFEQGSIPWEALRPLLDSLCDDEVRRLDGDPDALVGLLSPFIPELEQLTSLVSLPQCNSRSMSFPFWLENGIKGRKVEQLHAFVDALGTIEGSWLEWCAGKGHLGRMLGFMGAETVTSIELQQTLCADGQKSAEHQRLPLNFICKDVLKDDVSQEFKTHDHAVALHACGRLHETFLRQGSAAKCKQLIVSPCCYHLFTPHEYEAMSELGAKSNLNLTHNDVKLALQETVTAPNRTTKVRQKETVWRLGFDALQREVTGNRSYLSVPSVGKQIFSDSFSAFCHWAAEQKGISLPANVDYPHFLKLGEKRKHTTDRIELVRHAFRRAIEIWLVLDRVLYLQAKGYDVEVFEFCPKALTPRNVFIKGVLNNQDNKGEHNV
ncbi:FIG00951553: hypothetical protein [Pseudoalteromonas luteoviolacea B = ATCC 29581]|nr:FIG00951553: hypothetical protein [Pseudoalteromonas luteoviolacea B = ATCC 29581]